MKNLILTLMMAVAIALPMTAGDVTALYDYLLNNNSSHIVNGDQTGDGIITAADITAVYDILLGN